MPELTRRYVVMAMAAEAPFDPADPDGVFVLKPWKDPAALRALRTYVENCYPELGRDLDAWVRLIEAGPVIRGDVGRRNEPYARTAGMREPRAAKPAARRHAAPKKHARPAASTKRRGASRPRKRRR